MLDPGFTTEKMAAIFTPANWVEAMARFEAALALALADVGLIPKETPRRWPMPVVLR